MKICHECNFTKSITEFSIRRTSPDGLCHKCKSCVLKYASEHKEAASRHMATYFRNHKKEKSAWEAAYRTKHKEKKAAYASTYYAEHRAEIIDRTVKYIDGRRKRDPFYRMSCNLRSRLCVALRKKSWLKTTHFSKYIGCSREALKTYIEKQFQPGMTWDNHSLKGWHIDHIVPLVSASTEEELYKLCHYTNLQPLWAVENLHKGSSHVS